MSRRSSLIRGAVFAALLPISASVRAADVNWDNGSSNFQWDTSSLNWSGAAWNNAWGDGAIFGATGVGAINVPGPINVNSLLFTANGYTLNGAGPINFVNGVSTATTGVASLSSGVTATVNVPLNSAVGFQKVGPGVLELSGPSSFTGVIGIDPRAVTTAGLLIGGFPSGPLNGGTLRVLNSSVIPASTDVSIGEGYLDIGSNNQVLRNLTFPNNTPPTTWNTILNANNGVIGSGTLRVTGEINVIGQPSGASISNSIAANFDLGGGTQIIRTGVSATFGLHAALMFTGSVSNGSLFKTIGYNHNGVQANVDGIGLLNNNTYSGSTVLNGGQSLISGTNATSSIKLSGAFGAAGVTGLNIVGANGSVQGATLIQSFEGSTLFLDNNATSGVSGGVNQPFIPAAQNNDRVRDDAAIQLRSGNLTYRGLATAAATETFGNLNVLNGHNVVTITPNGAGGTATVTASGNLTMGPRATMQIAGTTLGAAGKVFVNGTIPTADATGILPRVIGSSDFMTYSGATGMTPLTTYTNNFTTPNVNVLMTANSNVAASININALKRSNTNTLTIDPGQTLTIDSGMILNTTGTGTITGGTIAFGPSPGVLWGTNVLASAVTGSAGLIFASGTGTISGDASGLTGSVDVYSGTANINTNTLFSPIHHRNGFLNINVPQTAVGLGAITVGAPETASDVIGVVPSTNISGAGAGAVINRNLIVDNGSKTAAGATLRYNMVPGLSPISNTGAQTQTWSGNITLNTGLRLQGGGPTNTNMGQTVFSGNVTGSDRFFIIASRASFTGNYSNAGGFLIGDQGFSSRVSFTGTGSGNGPMLISGGNTNTVSYTAGGLQGGPISVWNSSSGTQPQIIPLNNSVINNQIILGIGPKPGEEGNATANVGAGITAEWAGPLMGFSPLTKTGTGELVLSSNASTHTGAVLANAGTLRVNGTLPSSSVTIASGATLGGNGTILGPVTVNSGGILAPGGSIGTLATGSLNLAGAFDPEIDAVGALVDLVNVTGGVNVTTATLDLLLLSAPPTGTGTYLLVSNDGSDPVSGSFGVINSVPGYTATIDYAFSGVDAIGRVGDGNDIAVSFVPEPTSLALAMLALPVLAGRRRRGQAR